MKRSCNTVTARQRREQDRLRDEGCWICHRPCEIDHLVDRGTSRLSGGQDATINLCPWHHRGVIDEGFDSESMTQLWGPSFARDPADAKRLYGTKREILAKVNERIGRTTQPLTSKIFRRRAG